MLCGISGGQDGAIVAKVAYIILGHIGAWTTGDDADILQTTFSIA